MPPKLWLVCGGFLGALAVTLGAFAAHGLPGWLERQGRPTDEIPRAVANFETAARYQIYHALALVLVGLLSRQAPTTGWTVSGAAFVLGVAIFSGSLYALVVTNIKVLGAIVPIGGVAMIVGWVALALTAWRTTD